jgi:hypothetical protein
MYNASIVENSKIVSDIRNKNFFEIDLVGFNKFNFSKKSILFNRVFIFLFKYFYLFRGVDN